MAYRQVLGFPSNPHPFFTEIKYIPVRVWSGQLLLLPSEWFWFMFVNINVKFNKLIKANQHQFHHIYSINSTSVKFYLYSGHSDHSHWCLTHKRSYCVQTSDFHSMTAWPCFGRRVGLDDPQRSLPTPTILWFCDPVLVFYNHSPLNHYQSLPMSSSKELYQQ